MASECFQVFIFKPSFVFLMETIALIVDVSIRGFNKS